MRRNNIFIIQWIAWLCITLTACSGIEDDLDPAIQVNENGSDTRANLVEYTINVETAGSLKSLVEAGNYSNAQKLIITGDINYSDLYYVRYNMTTVEVLDLSGAMCDSNSSSFYGWSYTKIKEISLPKGLTEIRGWAFQNCRSLTSVTIPEGVTNIGDYAFSFCSSLSNITLPKGVTSIGDYAFYNCRSLTNLTLPKSVTSIGDDAFALCSSLTDLTISEGVTSIGNYVVSQCESLTNITIPKSVTSIGEKAFTGCSLKIIKWYTSCPITNYLTYLFDTLIIEPEGTTSQEDTITMAKRVIYRKEYSNDIYSDSGWYTISLPFKPTQITHKEKGTIAPFDSNIEDAKNFWLRELTPDGYRDVTEIEAGHAYIIAMPGYEYSYDFNLSGLVIFSAESVTLTWDPVVSVGPNYSMYPTFETVKKAKDVYALNAQYYVDGYDYGHVWVHSAMDVEPLQAYVKLNEGAATMRSVLPMADGKRTAVRGASSSSDASTRGVYGQRKPRKEDM